MLPFGFKSSEFSDVTLQLVQRPGSNLEGSTSTACDQPTQADLPVITAKVSDAQSGDSLDDTTDAGRRVRPRLDNQASVADAASSDPALSVPSMETLSEFPAHKILLAGKSSWFRGQLGTWQHNTMDQVLQVQLDPEDVPIFEVTVQHMYQSTDYNSNNPTASVTNCVSELGQDQLLKLLCLCDYYGCVSCAADAACALHQVGAEDLIWDVVHLVYSAPEHLINQSYMGRLQDVAAEKLHMAFDDLDAAMRDPELKTVWRALPASAVIAVLGDNETQAVSEDTVLSSLRDWVRSQDREPEATTMHTFFELVRVPQLTAAGLEYLAPLLPGFWSYLMDGIMGPRFLAAIKSPVYVPDQVLGPLSRSMFLRRPTPEKTSMTLLLSLSSDDIQRGELYRDRTLVPGTNFWKTGLVPHAGFPWELAAQVEPQGIAVSLACVVPRKTDSPAPNHVRSVFMRPTRFALRGLPQAANHGKFVRHGNADLIRWVARRPEGGWQQEFVEDKLLISVELEGPVRCDDVAYELKTL